jgi:hypothetical protein
MRISGHGVWMLVLSAVLVAGARRAQADVIQDRDLQWLGVHGAYYSEYERCALGINARTDVGNKFSVGFLLDYVFQPDNRTTWVTSADLQWEHRLPRVRLDGWVGGGLGVLRDDFPGMNRPADYQPFAVFFVGAGLARHPIMPYVETRFMSHDTFHGVLYAGLRF